MLSALYVISNLIPTITLCYGYYYYPFFPDKNPEVYRDKITRLRVTDDKQQGRAANPGMSPPMPSLFTLLYGPSIGV